MNFIRKGVVARECHNCGVELLKFLPEEERTEQTDAQVKWQHFQYVMLGGKRRLQMVEKEPPPGEMFSYFKSLLAKSPGHCLRANWQSKRLKILFSVFQLAMFVVYMTIQKNTLANIRTNIKVTIAWVIPATLWPIPVTQKLEIISKYCMQKGLRTVPLPI